jgi:hypothetical protein
MARLGTLALEKDYLILKRAGLSRYFDVLANGEVVGRIFKTSDAPVGSPWMWTLAFGHLEDRTPTHGYAATREAAMAAFAKSWRRESRKAPGAPGLERTETSSGTRQTDS